MSVYYCNSILTIDTKNISDKEMILYFTDLTEDLIRSGIDPGFHFMDNEESKALNMTITSTNINYQLVPPRNHRANNTDRAIQTFKNHFIEGM